MRQKQGPPAPKAIFQLANALARRHLGALGIFSVRKRVRRQLLAAAKAALTGRQRPCGRCRTPRLVHAGQAVLYRGRLRFLCKDCHAPVERHLEHPVLWNPEGV